MTKVSKRAMKNAMNGIKSGSGRPFVSPKSVEKLKSKSLKRAVENDYSKLASHLKDAYD